MVLARDPVARAMFGVTGVGPFLAVFQLNDVLLALPPLVTKKSTKFPESAADTLMAGPGSEVKTIGAPQDFND